MKRIVITSIALILVPTLLFLPFCILIFHSTTSHAIDYSQDIQGTWNAFQYYIDKDMFMCDDENAITIIFENETLSISGTGTVLPSVNEVAYTWRTGVSVSYTVDNQEVTLYISFDSLGNLIIKPDDGITTIYLRKAETIS